MNLPLSWRTLCLLEFMLDTTFHSSMFCVPWFPYIVSTQILLTYHLPWRFSFIPLDYSSVSPDYFSLRPLYFCPALSLLLFLIHYAYFLVNRKLLTLKIISSIVTPCCYKLNKIYSPSLPKPSWSNNHSPVSLCSSCVLFWDKPIIALGFWTHWALLWFI